MLRYIHDEGLILGGILGPACSLHLPGQANPPDPENLSVFGSVPLSMFTLFRVMSGAQSDEEARAASAIVPKKQFSIFSNHT